MTEQSTDTPRTRVIYTINSFDRGGAEAGLIALVRGGLFENCDLLIVGLVRGRGGLEHSLSQLNHRPVILLDRERMSVRDLPRLYFRLARCIAKWRPEIVIGSLPQANILARLAVMHRRRITFVSFEHNTNLSKTIYEQAFRLTSSRVDWTFSDADWTLKIAHRRLYRSVPERRSVIPLVSFDCAAQREGRPHDADDDDCEIVSAARMTGVKNQRVLIEAVAQLIHRGRKIRLTLYGEGPERENCIALAKRLGIERQVEFPGFVADWALRRADLFVLTSRHEGLCMSVIEAMHAGIPVLAPLIGGLQDYASEETIWVINSVEPTAVAAALIRAIDDTQETERRAAAATAMVNGRFGRKTVEEIYRNTNSELISSSKIGLNRHPSHVSARSANELG